MPLGRATDTKRNPMSFLHIIGMIAAIALIVGMAIYSGTKAKGPANDNSAGVVAGIIMGTLVGGSSTVGTAQLAYSFGMSAWWFTLGGGIGCLVLALVYATPMRAEKVPTVVGILRKEYGETVGLAASLLNTIGTFINIIAQLLAASAVVVLMFPAMGTQATIIIPAIVMVLYVVFGGTKGAGMVGIVKLVLLYASMVVCGVLALSLAGGLSGLVEMTRGYCAETGVNYFSVFARGVGKDLGAGLSLLVGVLTTQTYAQGVMSGKSDRTARVGTLAGAVLIPIIGVFGIIVGLYMRSVTDPATFLAKTALTQFVLDYLPPAVAGVVLGALFIASVGTGAGLALGISTILTNDVVKKFTHRFDAPDKADLLSKALIVVVLAGACLLSTGNLGDIIMNFSFMSMGLRGAVIFVPLTFALFAKGRVASIWALASVVVGPVAVLVGNLLALPFDPLFLGLAVNLVIMACGLVVSPKSSQ